MKGGGLSLVTAPALEPISLAEAKAHLRVDGVNEDALISRLIKTARVLAETITRRAFITQTWDWFLDEFPSDGFEVPRPTLQAITFIKFVDLNGVLQTLDPTIYIVDKAREPARITLNWLRLWPTYRNLANSINVRFVAGYGDNATDVAEPVRQAMLLSLTNWFENRSSIGANNLAELPAGAQALLWSERVSL